MRSGGSNVMIDIILAAIAAGVGYLIGGWVGAVASFFLYLPFSMWTAGEDEVARRRTQDDLRREPGE